MPVTELPTLRSVRAKPVVAYRAELGVSAVRPAPCRKQPVRIERRHECRGATAGIVTDREAPNVEGLRVDLEAEDEAARLQIVAALDAARESAV